MGGLTSLASTAVQALSVVNSIAGSVNKYKDDSGKRSYEHLKQKTALETQNARNQAAFEKEQIRLNSSQIEEDRRAALRRAIARQKAEFGANGIAMGNGSSEAVLLGLTNESETDATQRQVLDTLRYRMIDEGVSRQKRVNMLALTQEKERNKYNRYTAGYGLLSNVRDLFD